MSQTSLLSFFKSPIQSKKTSEQPVSKKKPAVSDNGENGKENVEKIVSMKQDVGKRKRTKTAESKVKKRRRVVIEDSSDESEGCVQHEDSDNDSDYKPITDKPEQTSDDDESSGDNSDIMETDENTTKQKKTASKPKLVSTPKSKPLVKLNNQSPANLSPCSTSADKSPASIRRKTLDKLASFSAPPESEIAESTGQRFHLSLPFLKPDTIRDINKRAPDHPEYDCRTLYVPDEFLRKDVTPAMRQWWELKVQYYDTVLFFKMGKFYEFFHMDADIGVKELGLIYMRGNYAHAGFPEKAYGRYADTLLRKGYKIARIEQTETPDMMNERLEASSKKSTKFDKVVKREVCQITTPGTRTSNYMDGESLDDTVVYLLAVCDKQTETGSRVGVCFVDTSSGKIQLGEFDEDSYGSRLRTLIAHYQPAQVLYEKRSPSPLLHSLLKTSLSSVSREALTPNKEFWTAEKTLHVLSESEYFKTNGQFSWPEEMKRMIADSDSIGRTPETDFSMALSSFGAVIWFLTFCFMDDEILSLKNVTEYKPLDSVSTEERNLRVEYENTRMILDSVTLTNLDILVNQSTGGLEGSLIDRLDNCHTPGGKRLLREWICAPLCNYKHIEDRLQALDDLTKLTDLSLIENEVLTKMPDIERLITRIHTLGLSSRSTGHPDSRAILFENGVYSRRKIESFLSLLTAFKKSVSLIDLFEPHLKNIKSKVLRSCVTFKADGGKFADIRKQLKYFDEAFDHEAARKAGAIHPARGFLEEYDSALNQIDEVNTQLDDYLKEQRKLLRTSNVNYFGSARNRYQLEVPDPACSRVPSHYEVSGQKKGYKRYTTTQTHALLAMMTEAEDRKTAALKDTMRRIFNKFDESYSQWLECLQCINILDVLVSLCNYTSNCETEMCRPEINKPTPDKPPLLEIRNGRHPCAVKTFGGGDFIPNDTILGSEQVDEDYNPNSTAQLLLLTGPNMGGKSTLMRQVGLISIMAQLGCYVPAERCMLTPIDRMFTRLGASDRIMHGESTFFVELSETSIILKHATRYSMVLLDELGRGTATHDGTAIASAVVRELCENVKCRTMFSTHYHSLVDDFKTHPAVQLGHMACMLNEEGAAPGEETITFLYKLAPNYCPKSYGFNVAKLAGLPSEVIKLGLEKTEELERMTEARKYMRFLLSLHDDEAVVYARKILMEH